MNCAEKFAVLLCFLDLSDELEVSEESLLLKEESYFKDIIFKPNLLNSF